MREEIVRISSIYRLAPFAAVLKSRAWKREDLLPSKSGGERLLATDLACFNANRISVHNCDGK